MEQNKTKGIYTYSMEYAIYLGLLLIAKMLVSSLDKESVFVSTLLMLFLMVVPVVGYVLTKRFRDVSGYSSFSQLFLFGVLMYFFASLLSGIFDYVYYQYLNPQFFQDQLSDVNKLLGEMVNAGMITDEEFAAQLEAEKPSSPIEVVYQGIWGMIMMGAIYSLFLALILRKKKTTVSNN